MHTVHVQSPATTECPTRVGIQHFVFLHVLSLKSNFSFDSSEWIKLFQTNLLSFRLLKWQYRLIEPRAYYCAREKKRTKQSGLEQNTVCLRFSFFFLSLLTKTAERGLEKTRRRQNGRARSHRTRGRARETDNCTDSDFGERADERTRRNTVMARTE